jgi:hypothetical protein
MPHEKLNPASAVVRAETGSKTFSFGDGNGSENTSSLPDLQAQIIARRHGLLPDRARLVASLYFHEARGDE